MKSRKLGEEEQKALVWYMCCAGTWALLCRQSFLLCSPVRLCSPPFPNNVPAATTACLPPKPWGLLMLRKFSPRPSPDPRHRPSSAWSSRGTSKSVVNRWDE
ncbi:hypothetical protein GW7_08320 [Heterocephalus glaber]|uniref:Uncharacterized protein n=1 Tax=Heterocephalus glaber TaxID=10181 RepID=G5C6R0_HETGA|nr:hypothetical protein GW7_08320 [Heterocephalus glaber]